MDTSEVKRAYSILTVKGVDSEQRVITGIATTPEMDRVGDIIEPLGVKFKNPLPLLHQHRSDQPVGTVKFDKPTAAGITFTARLPKIDEPGPLRDRVDTAWGEVKAGLVRAVSVGFRVLDDGLELLKTGGLRFTAVEVMELSLVTIPANQEATITAVKSMDEELRAASGQSQTPKGKRPSPGVSGTVRIPKSQKPKEGVMFGARIKDLENTRATKQSRVEAIIAETAAAGRTKNAEEQEEFDTLADEIETINKEVSDLQRLERLADQAKPVGVEPKAASPSRDPTRVEVRNPPAAEKGIRFAQLAMCLAKAKGHPGVASNLLQRHYPNHPAGLGLKAAHDQGEDYGSFISKLAEMRTKDAVDGGTTAAGSWAAPLRAHNDFSGDFIEYLRARTIIGQMGTGNIPAFRRIPFNVTIKGQSTGSIGGWTGQGQSKPVTKGVYFDAYHGFKKATAISVISDELIRFSDPAAEALVRDDIAAAVVAVLDGGLVDGVIGSASRPASLVYGVAGTPASGVDHVAIKTDLKTLWAPALAANQPIGSAVYWTTPAIAQSLSLMHGELSDSPLFPNIGLNGGSLLGVPVLVSNYVDPGDFILVFGQEVYLSDDNTVTVDASREATIEMETAPEASISDLSSPSPVPVDFKTGAAFVSMYQTNSVALRAERYVNWSKRRATAVNRLTSVEWGAESES